MAVTKSTLNSKLPGVSKIAFCSSAGKDMYRTTVNSYMRNALGWASPIALAKAVFPQGTLEALGVREIDPDLVNLTPMLIPHAIVRQ